jgi:hypothetical protein
MLLRVKRRGLTLTRAQSLVIKKALYYFGWVPIAEASRRSSFAPRTIKRWIEGGLVTAQHDGMRFLVDMSSVAEYIQTHKGIAI